MCRDSLYCFDFGDNPGNTGIGPVILQITNNGKRMAGIAKRREADIPDVKVSSRKRFFDIGVSRLSFGFIEDDKLDVRDIRKQQRFDFGDNPGDTGTGPVILQITNNGERMAGIAKRREADDTYVFGWRVQMSQVDTGERSR